MQLNSEVLLCCHRLKDIERGYWTFVTYFTRMDAVRTINKLTQVTTELGKGDSHKILVIMLVEVLLKVEHGCTCH